MEATSDEYVNTHKLLDTWYCPLGVDFAHAVGEMDTSCCHAMFAIHVFVKSQNVKKISAY
jgi:hypothetical protein